MKRLGRSPDFIVKAMNKDTDQKRKVGAAWANEDGTISIDLDAFTVLSTVANPNIHITLFPNDEKETKNAVV